MSVTLNVRYQVDSFGSIDDFSPEKIIGQSNMDIRRLVRNGTWLWSKVNRRVLYVYTATFGPNAVNDVVYAPLGTARATASKGRTRLEFWSDAENTDVRLGIFELDFSTQIGGFFVNSHGSPRSRITATYTGLTQQPIIVALEVQENDPAGGLLYGVRVREEDILVGDL